MDQALISGAEDLLSRCREAKIMVSSAESCTGGMIAAALTEVAGSSDVFERGFVTYSNTAKTQLLGVPADLIANEGAVSKAVARAMATGALENSEADLALAVTGVAGPGGGTAEKPVGLVYIAAARGERIVHEKCEFGAIGRSEIRRQTALLAFALAGSLL